MDFEILKRDCATRQKKGLHFILASVVIWILLLMTYLSNLPILSKNLVAFCCTAPLVPVAYLLSKLIRVDFQNKSNPLSILGIIFSVNQVLYLLIAMWIFSAVPDKMLMILAIIFGAHLMPYGWLYNSKSYFAMSVIIPVVSLAIGLNYEPYVLAIVMLCIESVFCMALFIENKKA